MTSNTMTVLEPDLASPTTTTTQSATASPSASAASCKYSLGAQHHFEEMLTTPKFMPDSAGLMSPRHLMAHASSSTSSALAACDDMLTTPVLTTPKTSDMWPPPSAASLSLLASRFSPDQVSTSSCSSPPPLPTRDLPMDSDIGLRSPCDGLLAKRRQKFRQKPSESSESVGAAPACDSAAAAANSSPRNSSPHDLTVKNGVTKDASRVQVKLEFQEDAPASSAEVHPSRSESTSSSSSAAPVINDFKHPIVTLSKSAASELPSHYTPSPLAVPSPNWMVVERYLGTDILRTPKVLDGTVFDFLGTVPITPRSKLGGGRDHSPHETDRYSGRDQRLSPRLSPRFPIPEAPTDLSSKASSSEQAASYSSEAEDLSVSAKAGSKRTKEEPPVSHYHNQSQAPQQHNHHVQLQHQFHQDHEQQVPRLPHQQHLHRHSVSETAPSRSVSPPPAPAIKTEASELQASAQTFAPASFAPFYNFYSRQMYQTDLQRSLVNNHYQQMASASGFGGRGHLAHQQSVDMMYDVHQGHGYGGLQQPHGHLPHQQHQMWPSPLGLPLIHPSQDGHQRPNSQMSWSPDRRSREDEDGEDDAEAGGAAAGYPMPAMALKNNLLLSPSSHGSETPKKKRASKSKATDVDDESGGPKKRNKGKGKAPKEANGSKRTYVCPHCQRSYDWNYNLNRHLKYECGKENAFQCSKCGRKFPHKQNCVYHLKRKHKVVCDTIDQYMSAGLVIFRGMAGAHADGGPGDLPLAPQVMIKEEFGLGSSLGSDN